ncbi:MAG: DUF1289 domain-containing protein [Betaproteobacteria bacterium]|nr:DUF1289 domain-containing protein [Betaproteobacteria bacterium]
MAMTEPSEEIYPCVGICTPDPDSGYCLGCGRPPLASPEVVAEPVAVNLVPRPKTSDPDNPE